MQLAQLGPQALSSGAALPEVQIAYENLGALAPTRDNAVLVLHGYTSGPDFILPEGEAAEGSWAALIGPGRAIDTNRYFVIAPNALGSAYGSTSAASIDPSTQTPYGSRFSALTLSDMVESQRRLLVALGIERLRAVIGVSFGGMLAFQWGVDQPDMMAGVAPVLSSPRAPPADAAALRASLAQDPNWHGGDYYGCGDMSRTQAAMRLQTALKRCWRGFRSTQPRASACSGRDRTLGRQV